MELFMQAGGDYVDRDSLTATPAKVLEGEKFLGDGSDDEQTGTMTDRSQVGTSPTMADDHLIPIHTSNETNFVTDSFGTKKLVMCPPDGAYPGRDAYVGEDLDNLGITPGNIADGTTIGNVEGTYTRDANAVDQDIRAGKSAYIKGEKVYGALPDKGSVYKELNAGETYNIEKGCYEDGRVVAKNLSSQTQATAGAYNILDGKTAYVNGQKVTGTFPNKGQNQYGSGMTEGSDYYAINGLPEGAYLKSGNTNPEARLAKSTVRNYLGISAAKIAKGQTIGGVAGTFYGNKKCIGASVYDSRNGSDSYAEQSFTMPANGTVYYGGCAGGWYYSSDGSWATCAVYKNGNAMDNRNISGGSYMFRGTMFNKSFSASAGDVIKIIAQCGRGSGDFIMSCVQAVIVY